MTATDSQVALWRGAIALAWADNHLHDDERAEFTNFIDKNKNLSDEQKKLLKQDLSKQVKLEEIWPQITDKMDRAHLINIAPTIFWGDKDYSHSEKEVFEKMYADHMASLDMKTEMQDMANFAQKLRLQSDIETAKYVKPVSFISRLIYNIEKGLGLDKDNMPS